MIRLFSKGCSIYDLTQFSNRLRELQFLRAMIDQDSWRLEAIALSFTTY